jgi:hypothetical protein
MPIRPIDLLDIRRYRLQPERLAGPNNEYQYYISPDGPAVRRPTVDRFGRAVENLDPKAFLYRAMSLEEFDGYRRTGVFAKGSQAHQGWTPDWAYALGYLRPNTGYSRLVEVYAADFLSQLSDHGWSHKAESAAISYGIGDKQSNGYHPRRGLPGKRCEALHPWEIFHDALHRNGWVTLYGLLTAR